jgi:hypothetical protein
MSRSGLSVARVLPARRFKFQVEMKRVDMPVDARGRPRFERTAPSGTLATHAGWLGIRCDICAAEVMFFA